MSRDYTKYNVTGVGESLNKRSLVFNVVKDWISKNNPSFEEIVGVFTDEIQGSAGFIRKERDVKDPRRFNMKEPLVIKNGMHIVVSNQWGDNIAKFIVCAESLGYSITPVMQNATKTETGATTKSDSVITSELLEGWIGNLFHAFKDREHDEATMDQIDEEIEGMLAVDSKYYVLGKMFEQFGYDYYNNDRRRLFIFDEDEDPNETRRLLSEDSLLSRVIKKHGLESEISDNSIDFKLYFAAYFLVNLEILIELDDEDMIAEFIVNQSITTIEDDFDFDDSMMGDWIADLTLDILKFVYGIDVVNDFEGECSLSGYYFGYAQDMGYNYTGASRALIDSVI